MSPREHMDDRFPLPLEWTARKVWLHPCMARDIIDESVINIMNLDRNLRNVQNSLCERSRLCEQLQTEKDGLISSLEEREEELEAARKEAGELRDALGEAREELALHKSVDEKLEEFNSKLSEIENMKRRYEKRIALLERMVRRYRNSVSDSSDELALDDAAEDASPVLPVIEMAPPERVDLALDEGALRRRPKTDTDTKTPGPKAQELRRSYQEKRAPGLPEKFPEPPASDEWLLDLPDTL